MVKYPTSHIFIHTSLYARVYNKEIKVTRGILHGIPIENVA